tara:strand:- start:1195 stop:2196 length:1002 start_codon:yes stop_codon:yes gene_type:complete
MRFLHILIILTFNYDSFSQEFSFFSTDFSATSLSLGGNVIAKSDDVSLTYKTTSLLDQSQINYISFDYLTLSNEINLFSFVYANKLKKIGMYNFGVKNLNYGNFQGYDVNGFQTNEFHANDLIFFTGVSKMITKELTLGLNLELLNSNYESFSALAIASNTSLTYNNKKRKLIFSFSLNNLGRQINGFTDIKEKVPTSLKFGMSKSLNHLPFTYYISLHDLQRFDISGPVQASQSYRDDETILKKMFYHVNIGGELNPFKKNLFLRFGFNFQKRYQMMVRNIPQLAGFSSGVGIKFSSFTLDYAIISNHISSVSNVFSLKMNLSSFVPNGKKD